MNHELKNCFWRCKKCKKQNNFEKDYWFNQKQVENTGEQKKEDYLFVACMNIKTQKTITWVIDSGCSSHMSNCKDQFVYLDENFKSQV